MRIVPLETARPRLSFARRILLAATFTAALTTSLLAGLFHSGNASAGKGLQAGISECPMTSSPKTGR
ncbi:MAG: hypothetical protein ABIU54_13580 [Candidatus Eisenbacteria bacterium]